ncbi:hypothetical protein ACM16X_20630 [Haloarcula japonica]|uniref:hypothetical protein n=1 Tax=Haloarcula japonica TaxID=29282 RepID=UPI0039F65DB4
MAPTIKSREDIDGCGCLECRNIETTTTNRTVLDALVWSVRLFRSYPSIIAFAGVTILANRLLETDIINMLPLPVIGVLDGLTAFVFIILIRAYVGTIVAGELTANSVTIREGVHRSIARTPALIGVTLLIVFSVMTVPFFLFLPLLLFAGAIPGNPADIVGFPVVAAVSVLAFAVPFLGLLFKFWFALEACVIGQYGPIKSLRISWQITTNYRRKFVLIAIIAIGSVSNLYLPEMGTSGASVTPVLRVLSTSVGDLLSIVWAGAYAHLYIQEIVS